MKMIKALKVEVNESLKESQGKQNYSRTENGNKNNTENTNREFWKWESQVSEQKLQTQASYRRWKRNSQVLKIITEEIDISVKKC